jgi:hypothetical protein
MAPALRRRRTKSFLLITCTSKAQSQDQGQSQLAASIPQASGPADYQIDTPVTVTSQSTAQNGPVLAQLFPGFTVGNAGVDPVMEVLQQGRIPGAAEYAARAAQQGYSPNIGDPTLQRWLG